MHCPICKLYNLRIMRSLLMLFVTVNSIYLCQVQHVAKGRPSFHKFSRSPPYWVCLQMISLWRNLKGLNYYSTKIILGWLQVWNMPYISFSSWLEVASLFSRRDGFGLHYPKHADSVLRFFLIHLPVLALKTKDKRRLLLSRSLIRK